MKSSQLTVALFCLLSASAIAQNWNGSAGDHKWSTPGNWVENAAPTNGAFLVFPDSATDKAPNNDIAGLTLFEIKFTGSGYTISGQAFTGGAGGIVWNNFASGTNELDLDFTVFHVTVDTGSTLILGGVRSGVGFQKMAADFSR